MIPNPESAIRPKRRWLQFSLRTLLFVMLALSLVFAWPHLDRHYARWQLQAYVGKDLLDLVNLQGLEREKFERCLHVLKGNRFEAEPWYYPQEGFHPNGWTRYYRLERTNLLGDQCRYLLVQVQNGCFYQDPRTTYGRIVLLDGQFQELNHNHFTIGYRDGTSRISFDETRGFPCLEMQMEHYAESRESHRCAPSRRYYLLGPREVTLLRSETLEGKMLLPMGLRPAAPLGSTDELKQQLNSNQLTENLRAMSRLYEYYESPDLALLDPAIRERLMTLGRSPDPWTREAATALLTRIERTSSKRLDETE